MNFKYLVFTFVSFFVAVSINAQESKLKISLEEAQEIALQHNKALENVRQDVNIAAEQYKQARGQGLPQIEGSLDYMTNFNYEAAFSFGGGAGEGPQIDYSLLDAGDMEILKLLQGSGEPASTSIKLTDQSNAQIQLSQLIFGGQYWVGLQTARIAQELASKNVVLTELDVKENVANTYQLILASEEIMEVLLDNISNLKAMQQHTQNMYEAGLAEQTDVDQISISVSQLENQHKSMDRNIRLSYNMLRYQMGVSFDQEIELTNTMDQILDELIATNSLTQEFNIQNNVSFQMIETQLDLQEKLVDMEKWAYAPTLVGFYSYTKKIKTSGFDISPNNAAGLNLNIPIFSSGIRKANVSKAKIELDKAERSKDMVEEQLLLQNNQLRSDFTNAFENYQTQRNNVSVAKRVLESMQHKYRQGLISSLDLTQTNTSFLEAESNYLNAAIELMQAHLKLKKLYNQL
ncbi:MAG: TolC family protein [Bacteroidales bacterium]|jgi:outer membrane protein TolC|nr:TolC family protein [Bacteroidales bacterium]HOI32198.1 TolC family protein [Bacteroidales bacterium]